MTVNILGTPFEVLIKGVNDDPAFNKRNICGYCDSLAKQIVVADPKSVEGFENDPQSSIDAARKETLRHEIVHAFLQESGLFSSSLPLKYGWAVNEEMIDWIAIQGPKLCAAWKEVGAL